MMARPLVPWKAQLPQFFGDFVREVENLFEQVFTAGNAVRGIQAFVPRTTVAETDDGYEVEVDLPGMKPEDVQVEMRGNELRLTGERKQEKEEKGKNYHRIAQEPRRSGSRPADHAFSRRAWSRYFFRISGTWSGVT
jgi:HSP20 family protein